MSSHTDNETLQKAHFNRIADLYHLHTSDLYSTTYRSEFIVNPFLRGIDIKGRKVLDAMCGSGQVTYCLVPQGALVTGLDISSEVIEGYRRYWPSCEAICASIFDSGIATESFDVVVSLGGLHHIQPDVSQAIDEIYRILKPGGYFCFMEPHQGSLPDFFRKLWYKRDSLFEKNEEAIDLNLLEMKNKHRFEFLQTQFGGNIGYLFIYNSMTLRIPLGLKKFYGPGLLWMQKRLSPFFNSPKRAFFALAQWKKKIL